jgi:hypothetical protein
MIFNTFHTFLELNVQVRDLTRPRCGMQMSSKSLEGIGADFKGLTHNVVHSDHFSKD